MDESQYLIKVEIEETSMLNEGGNILDGIFGDVIFTNEEEALTNPALTVSKCPPSWRMIGDSSTNGCMMYCESNVAEDDIPQCPFVDLVDEVLDESDTATLATVLDLPLIQGCQKLR